MGVVDVCPPKQIDIGCKNDTYGNNRYMCLPKEDKSSLVEFCYEGNMGIEEPGACLEASVGGIRRFNCSSFKYGCPEVPFHRYNVHKYPACQTINTELRCYVLDPTCPSQRLNEETSSSAITYALLGILISIPVVILAAFLIRRLLRNKAPPRQSPNGDNPEILESHALLNTKEKEQATKQPPIPGNSAPPRQSPNGDNPDLSRKNQNNDEPASNTLLDHEKKEQATEQQLVPGNSDLTRKNQNNDDLSRKNQNNDEPASNTLLDHEKKDSNQPAKTCTMMKNFATHHKSGYGKKKDMPVNKCPMMRAFGDIVFNPEIIEKPDMPVNKCPMMRAFDDIFFHPEIIEEPDMPVNKCPMMRAFDDIFYHPEIIEEQDFTKGNLSSTSLGTYMKKMPRSRGVMTSHKIQAMTQSSKNIPKLLRVWSCDRQIKTSILLFAHTMDELKKECAKKINTKDLHDVHFVLEKDGTKIDDDKHLQNLEKNTVLLILQQHQHWSSNNKIKWHTI